MEGSNGFTCWRASLKSAGQLGQSQMVAGFRYLTAPGSTRFGEEARSRRLFRMRWSSRKSDGKTGEREPDLSRAAAWRTNGSLKKETAVAYAASSPDRSIFGCGSGVWAGGYAFLLAPGIGRGVGQAGAADRVDSTSPYWRGSIRRLAEQLLSRTFQNANVSLCQIRGISPCLRGRWGHGWQSRGERYFEGKARRCMRAPCCAAGGSPCRKLQMQGEVVGFTGLVLADRFTPGDARVC